MFQDCSIYLILNDMEVKFLSISFRKQIIKFKNSNVFIVLQGDTDKILVKPINFPVTLTKYNYKFSQNGPYHWSFACNGIKYHLQKPLSFHQVSPPPRMFCFAQTYINAVPCTTISSKEITGQRGDTFSMPHVSALNTIFDYRLEISSQDSMDATKCCTYYIHVEIHKANWVYHLQNQRKVAFHYAELLQEYLCTTDLPLREPVYAHLLD